MSDLPVYIHKIKNFIYKHEPTSKPIDSPSVKKVASASIHAFHAIQKEGTKQLYRVYDKAKRVYINFTNLFRILWKRLFGMNLYFESMKDRAMNIYQNSPKLSDPIPQEIVQVASGSHIPLRLFDSICVSNMLISNGEGIFSSMIVCDIYQQQISGLVQTFTKQNVGARDGFYYTSTHPETDIIAYQAGISTIIWFAEKSISLVSLSNTPATVIKTAAVFVGSSPHLQQWFYRTPYGEAVQEITHNISDRGFAFAKMPVKWGIKQIIHSEKLKSMGKWSYTHLKEYVEKTHAKRMEDYSKEKEEYNKYSAICNEYDRGVREFNRNQSAPKPIPPEEVEDPTPKYKAELFQCEDQSVINEKTAAYLEDLRKYEAYKQAKKNFPDLLKKWEENKAKLMPSRPKELDHPVKCPKMPQKTYLHKMYETTEKKILPVVMGTVQSFRKESEEILNEAPDPVVWYVNRTLKVQKRANDFGEKVLDNVAGKVVMKAWTAAKFAWVAKQCLFRSAKTVTKRQHMISAVMIVAQGGPKQSIEEFSLRTITAVGFYVTGSTLAAPVMYTFMATQMVYGLRQDYYNDRREEIMEDMKKQGASLDQVQKKLEELGFDDLPENKVVKQWSVRFVNAVSDTLAVVSEKLGLVPDFDTCELIGEVPEVRVVQKNTKHDNEEPANIKLFRENGIDMVGQRMLFNIRGFFPADQKSQTQFNIFKGLNELDATCFRLGQTPLKGFVSNTGLNSIEKLD